MAVAFRLLGSVELRVDDRPVDIGHARQQCVLLALLVDANTTVSVDQLVDRVWADRPPATARNALQVYLRRLRTVLAGVPDTKINRDSGGYRLAVPRGSVDLHLFRLLRTQARDAVDARASTLYQQALDLWRGDAFAGLDNDWLGTLRLVLDEERFAAELDQADLLLRTGQHLDLLPILTDRAERRPFDERLAGQLMLALYRGGRQADALAHYELTRGRLREELGADPSPPLRRLHEQIMRGERALIEIASVHAHVASRSDLPGDVADFTGRVEELNTLLDAVSDVDDAAAAATIAVIDGMAGVGKTALALRTAHRLAERYPDGQFFLDLHGHTEGRQPVEPTTALASLLSARGVPNGQIPDSVEDRASRWRAELAGRKVLVVLDNVATATQVRPLLPGGPESLTLVTSRRRLTDLDATCSLSLDLLPPKDATALFARVAGPNRVSTEPDAVADLARLCGYLPLALRIAGARLRTRPAWSVAYLAGRLGDERRRLAELSAGDRSVAATFMLSYYHLTTPQQRLFRLVGLVPGPDFDAGLAAALINNSVTETEDNLEQLLDAHLLIQSAPGRYHLHDLLAAHARALAWQQEPATEPAVAIGRMLDYYRAAGTRVVRDTCPVPGVTDQLLPDTANTTAPPATNIGHSGLFWFRTECPNLSAAYQLVPKQPSTLTIRLELLTLLAFAQCFGGQVVEGIDSTRQLLALIPPEDDSRRVAAANLCSIAERRTNSPEAAKSVLLSELRSAPERPSEQTARLRLRLASEHLATGDVTAVTPILDELDVLGLGTCMRFVVAVMRSIADYLAGHLPAALAQADRADKLCRELSPAERMAWSETIAWLGVFEIRMDRRIIGLERIDRTIASIDAGNNDHMLHNNVWVVLAAVKSLECGLLGRLDDARYLAEQAVTVARRIGVAEVLTIALSAHSLVLAWVGDQPLAQAVAEEAAALAEARLDWQSILARCAPGLVALYTGENSAGRALVRTACDEYEHAFRDESTLLMLLEPLANAEAEAGIDTMEWADRADRVHHPEHITNAALASLTRAHAHSVENPANSAQLALSAADALATAGLRFYEGRARLRAGRSLAAIGEHERARIELARSVSLFADCNARALHAQAVAAHEQHVVDQPGTSAVES